MDIKNMQISYDCFISHAHERMLEIWQKDFFHNATIPDDAIKIRKEDIVWSLIVDLCAFDKSDSVI